MAHQRTYRHYEADARSYHYNAQRVADDLKQDCIKFLDTERDHNIKQKSIQKEELKARDESSTLEGRLQIAKLDRDSFRHEPQAVTEARSRLNSHRTSDPDKEQARRRVERFEREKGAAQKAYENIKHERCRLESRSTQLRDTYDAAEKKFDKTKHFHEKKKSSLIEKLTKNVHGAYYSSNQALELRRREGQKLEKNSLNNEIIEKTGRLLQGPKHLGKGPLWNIRRDDKWSVEKPQ